MSSNRNITAETVFYHMTPATLIAFIADLDEQMAANLDSGDEALLMKMALGALRSNVGSHDAIQMMADAEIYAANPIIENALDEWTQSAALLDKAITTGAIEQARQGERQTQIWQDRTSGDKWAVEIENGIAVGAFGPLTMEDAESIKADPDAWEGDSETAGWLNETTDDYRVVWPYISG